MPCELLKDSIFKSADRWPATKAISFLRDGKRESEITYGQLNQDVNRLANSLLDLGVREGDRVIFFLEKCLFQVVAHLALQKIGAISVPLNPGFKKPEMSYFLEDAKPALVFTGTEELGIIKDIGFQQKTIVIDTRSPYERVTFFREYLDESPGSSMRTQDAGVIIYTSGTTGQPKGAILTQGNLVHDARNVIDIWEITEKDVLCHALPLFHVHGLCFALHTALIAGTHVLMLDKFSPERVVSLLSKKEPEDACTIFMAVPSMYNKMLDLLRDRRPDFSHMRLWTSGSAPLLAQDFERIRQVLGKEPIEREGMTETGMNFSNPIRGQRKPSSIGLPLPELDVRIVDPITFEDVSIGQVGEIWLRGPGVSPGYWGKPKETLKAFEKKWFRTGDLGRIDEEGYYYLTDRIKHIIISGGENISPKEIQSVINQLEGIIESAVTGISDPKWGEKVVAAVVKKADTSVSLEDIRAHCKTYLHDWKCPKEIVFVSELPKNTMGKVLMEKVKGLFNPASRQKVIGERDDKGKDY